MADPSSIPTGVTLGIALTGATLGVLNFWRSVTRDRVNVKVTPRRYATDSGLDGFCIEVINLGFIPITIDQVGFTLPKGQVMLPVEVSFVGSLRLPERLEPRTSLTYYFRPGASKNEDFSVLRGAFAQTACGKTFKGKSDFLKAPIQHLAITTTKPPL
jgi:hypothetical protein